MKFLAVSTNTGDPRPFLADETVRVGELVQTGIVQQFFVKADWSGSVMIVEGTDASSALSALGTLPLVVQGVTSFDLTEIVDPPPSGTP